MRYHVKVIDGGLHKTVNIYDAEKEKAVLEDAVYNAICESEYYKLPVRVEGEDGEVFAEIDVLGRLGEAW